MAQPPLCIDTDVLIDFLRARGDRATVFEAALSRYRCALSSITVYEVCFGVERFGRLDDRHQLESLFTVVEIVPFDLIAAQASAQLDATLQKAGLRLEFPDLFIAGICLARELLLLTRNLAHFSRVPHLKLLDPQHLSPHR